MILTQAGHYGLKLEMGDAWKEKSMPLLLLLLEAFAFFAVLGGTSVLVQRAATNEVLGVPQPSRRRPCMNTEKPIINPVTFLNDCTISY